MAAHVEEVGDGLNQTKVEQGDDMLVVKSEFEEDRVAVLLK